MLNIEYYVNDITNVSIYIREVVIGYVKYRVLRQ